MVSHFSVPHQVVQHDEVVLDQHKDALIDDLQSFVPSCFEELCMSKVNEVQKGHVDH